MLVSTAEESCRGVRVVIVARVLRIDQRDRGDGWRQESRKNGRVCGEAQEPLIHHMRDEDLRKLTSFQSRAGARQSEGPLWGPSGMNQTWQRWIDVTACLGSSGCDSAALTRGEVNGRKRTKALRRGSGGK